MKYISVIRRHIFRYCYGIVDVIIVTLFTDPPVVSLSLGSNLEAGDIKEGDDVYFECNVTGLDTNSIFSVSFL